MSLGSFPIPRPPSPFRWSAQAPVCRRRSRVPSLAWRERRRPPRGRHPRSRRIPTRAGKPRGRGSGTLSEPLPPSGRRRPPRRSSPTPALRPDPSAPSPPWPAPLPAAPTAKRRESIHARRHRVDVHACRCSARWSPLLSPACVELDGRPRVDTDRGVAVAVAVPAPVLAAWCRFVAAFGRCLEEAGGGQADHQAKPRHHPRPPASKFLRVAKKIVTARPLQIAAEPLDPLGRALGHACCLLTVTLLAQLRAAAPKRLRHLASLTAGLGRPFVQRLAELAPTLLLQLGRLLLGRRGRALHLRPLLAHEAFPARLTGGVRHATPTFLRRTWNRFVAAGSTG